MFAAIRRLYFQKNMNKSKINQGMDYRSQPWLLSARATIQILGPKKQNALHRRYITILHCIA